MPGEQNVNNPNINTPEELKISTNINAKLGAATQILGRTQDGMLVHDRIDSHFHSEGGLTKELFEEALSKIDTGGRNFVREIVDFGRVIGKSTCVEVGPEDEIVYAYRAPRRGLSPLVKNREAIPCSSIIIAMSKDKGKENTYTLRTGFIGGDSPREPWDSSLENDAEYQKAKEFWDNHALLYDEDSIDHVKTNAYNAMSDEEKLSEQMSFRTFYSGLFVDKENLLSNINPQLEKVIEAPHVTTNFQPDHTQVHLDQIGTQAKITAIGYGNDGMNEGLLVKVEADDPEIQAAVDKVRVPHITLSLAKGALPQNTEYLEFTPLEKPFEITGTYGIYTRGRGEESKNTVLSQEALKEAEKEVRI